MTAIDPFGPHLLYTRRTDCVIQWKSWCLGSTFNCEEKLSMGGGFGEGSYETGDFMDNKYNILLRYA